jgi:GTPase Era involved in 16S rRNA processing
LAKLKRYCKKQGLELFPISAVTGKGIDELKYAIAEKLEEVKASLQSDAASQKDSTSVADETELLLRSRKTS